MEIQLDHSWEEIEKFADNNGWLAADIYNSRISSFRVCPPQDPTATESEAMVWQKYLSATSKHNKRLMYHEMYRYDFYEGKRRRGFWGNIEDAVRTIAFSESPRITIFSAGVGRDLLKVGLSAGIWESRAPDKIRGTYKEISPDYFFLGKPAARIMVTEYENHVFAALSDTVNQLIKKGLCTDEMISVRQWDFRYRSPLKTATQDLAVFALVGNYATIQEQPLILREIARCLSKGGYLVAATMLPAFDFSKAHLSLRKIQIILSSPLMWPILSEVVPWQVQWAKMAGMMNAKGYWHNTPAKDWATFLESSGMRLLKVYPAPSSLIPVEVLVAQKE